MKSLLSLIGLVALAWIGFHILADKGVTPLRTAVAAVEPDLENISVSCNVPYFGDPTVHSVFRNKGANGKTLVTITQGSSSWKFVTYYDRDEQREAVFTVPGLVDGAYHVETVPADLANADQLAGASSAN